MSRDIYLPFATGLTRRGFIRMSSAAAAGALLAACGVNDQQGVTTTAPPGSTTLGGVTTIPSATTTPSVVAGTINWAAEVLPANLDPMLVPLLSSFPFRHAMYDRLTSLDAEYNLIPQLAESWQMLDDTTWEFKLRSDVVWHNGDPFTAEDVKFSIERIIDPDSGSTQGGTFASVATVEVVDDYTVNVLTTEPDINLAGTFGRADSGFMIPAKYFGEVGAEAFDKEAVGSGPYVLERFEPDVQLELVANPEYWNGTPPAERIVMFPRPEAAARVGALLAGEANFITGVPWDQVPELEENPDTTVATVPAQGAQFTLFANTEVPPLDNKLIRQALSLAVDRQAIVDSLFHGRVRVSTGPFSPGDLGAEAMVDPLPFDPDQAASLLSDAEYDGEEIVVQYRHPGLTGQDESVVLTLVQMWQQAGLNVRAEIIEPAAFVDTYSNTKDFKGLFITGVASYVGDPGASIWPAAREGGGLRYWTNDEFDALGEEAATSFDEELRRSNYARMLEIMLDEMPWITLFDLVFVLGFASNIELSNPLVHQYFGPGTLRFTE